MTVVGVGHRRCAHCDRDSFCEPPARSAALVVAPDLEAAEILAQLRPDIEPAFLPRPLYRVPELPRQETGKLARNKLVELYAKIRNAEL